MIAVICSMYNEAKAFIVHYGLKKIESASRFQIFINSDIVLAVSGVGNMSSAICSAHIVTAYDIDLLVNVGVCAASGADMKIGDIYLCNKISSETGKFFYSDILYQHDFCEAEVFSLFKLYTKGDFERKNCLFDMESFGIMETAYAFLSPHQVVVIKVVSDYGDTLGVTPDMIYTLVRDTCDKIAALIDAVHNFNLSFQLGLMSKLSENDMRIIKDICSHFKFTVTMEHEILRYAKLYRLKNNTALDFLEKHMSVVTKTKNDGKAIFNVIKRELTQ